MKTIANTTKTPGTQTISARTSPCRCGCKGADPWHRPYYDRVVAVDNADWTRGWVQLPFAAEPVLVRRRTAPEVLLSSLTWSIGDIWEVVQSSVVYK